MVNRTSLPSSPKRRRRCICSPSGRYCLFDTARHLGQRAGAVEVAFALSMVPSARWLTEPPNRQHGGGSVAIQRRRLSAGRRGGHCSPATPLARYNPAGNWVLARNHASSEATRSQPVSALRPTFVIDLTVAGHAIASSSVSPSRLSDFSRFVRVSAAITVRPRSARWPEPPGWRWLGVAVSYYTLGQPIDERVGAGGDNRLDVMHNPTRGTGQMGGRTLQ